MLLALLVAPKVTLWGLIADAVDPAALARLPFPAYEQLQATSYNRESVHRTKPGWFADSDGTGYIRKDGDEYVLMEHTGPGCITRLWTPFFYYDFNDRVGPNVRIELDGKRVMDESLIKLVMGKGSISEPWAQYTARAGDCYLPLPFAKSARVTMTKPPFYFSINYRAYAPGTQVETYDPKTASYPLQAFQTPEPPVPSKSLVTGKEIKLPGGSRALEEITFKVDPKELPNLDLIATFDGVQTISCPLADFFSSADKLHTFETLRRTVQEDGTLTCRWIMPYQKSGSVMLRSRSQPVTYRYALKTRPWKWDARSMHFFARWRGPAIMPGTPFIDWNFIDIKGQGFYVGDAWTAVNPRPNSWWGEGDEKIYLDGDWEKGFPRHFGTGTEDYYGWAGGVYPTLEDNFSQPYLMNVVGGLDGHTQGTNVLVRERGLDAIPFKARLRFDMEASFGTDMREKHDLLGYSAVTFFYARPGATHNRPAVTPSGRTRPYSVDELKAEAARIKG